MKKVTQRLWLLLKCFLKGYGDIEESVGEEFQVKLIIK